MSQKDYQELEHTADVAVRVHGKDLPELLKHAGIAMFDIMQVQAKAEAGCSRTIEIEAYDAEELLVSWLEELLFALETEKILLRVDCIEIREPCQLTARVMALPAGRPTKEIKAVTYHGLQVRQHKDGLVASVVFDV